MHTRATATPFPAIRHATDNFDTVSGEPRQKSSHVVRMAPTTVLNMSQYLYDKNSEECLNAATLSYITTITVAGAISRA